MNAHRTRDTRLGRHARVPAALLVLALTACGALGTGPSGAEAVALPAASAGPSAPPAPGLPPTTGQGAGGFTMDQTLSDNAQLTTIAFDGLAFLTGTFGSDSFFPPGKVADFWGFQSLRDNDPSAMGHNTDFLTRASLATLDILTTAQRAQLIGLAKDQVAAINSYGYKRFVLMSAFRRLLAGKAPTGSSGLSAKAVRAYSASLYRLDGRISLARAAVMGEILHGLDAQQRVRLDAMVGAGMTSWPVAQEPEELRGLSHDEKVAVMTYAGDMFSWYAGDVEDDVYFCPERQGTYFGSFYLKDAPAVGNPGYSIGTNITADMGRAFLEALTPAQRARISGLVDAQRTALRGIVEVRRAIATELRKELAGGTADREAVLALMTRYGQLDGTIATKYATAFTAVAGTLTAAQRAVLLDLRRQTIGTLAPTGAYLYAEPIPMPKVRSTRFLFQS